MKEVDLNKYWNYVSNPITKAGVFDYLGSQISPELDPNRIYKVYRPASELASEEALKSLRLLPIVDDHQMLGTAPGMQPAEEKGVHGVLGENAYIKDDYLYSDMRIFSEHLKEQINNGKRQLSLGYRCDYDWRPGEYNGTRYDMSQKNYCYNHLALVDEGRMGPDVCVMDSRIGFNAKGYAVTNRIDDGWPEVVYCFGRNFREKDPETERYLSRKKGD